MHEPSKDELAAASALLAAFYNDPHNAALMSNTVRFTAPEVVQLWRDAARDGARLFLLSVDGVVVGDADFRHVDGRSAELAILIGPRERQGQGLGARFVALLLRLGFADLGLDRVHVAIRPGNSASLRLFARAGFLRDDSPEGRAYAEEDDDVCMVLRREPPIPGPFPRDRGKGE